MKAGFGFITCASDRMAGQLRLLLMSCRKFHREVPIGIIPFSDDIEECRRISDEFSAVIVERNPVWDELGEAIFGGVDYRPGVSASHYFRKLNCFTGPFENFLYTDCNVVLLDSQDEVASAFEGSGFDIVFYARAKRGRNFRSEFRDLLGTYDTRVNEGYNAAYIMARRGLIGEPEARAWLPFADFLRSGIAKAPEQGYLGAMIAFGHLKSGTVADILPGAAPINTTKFAVAPREEGWHYVNGPWAGQRVFTLKWIGQSFPYTGPNAWVADLSQSALADQ